MMAEKLTRAVSMVKEMEELRAEMAAMDAAEKGVK